MALHFRLPGWRISLIGHLAPYFYLISPTHLVPADELIAVAFLPTVPTHNNAVSLLLLNRSAYFAMLEFVRDQKSVAASPRVIRVLGWSR